MPASEILCVGELLWDALPAGLFLGGSPFNVACHLRAAGLPVAMVTRVGADRLGEEALRRAAQYGIATDLVQVDPALPTGFVRVELGATGEPAFDILTPAAWDAVEPTDALLARAASARAVVFDTLAQRGAVTRGTVERLCETDALLVYDANLRAPHDDPAVVRRSLERAAVVKVTEGELRQVAAWFGLAGAEAAGRAAGRPAVRRAAAALAEAFGCRAVCVTRGRRGAALWRDGEWAEHPGYEVEVRDLVGAGDAFLSVVVAGLLSGAPTRALLQNAALLGAYVATQAGAVPADQPAAGPRTP